MTRHNAAAERDRLDRDYYIRARALALRLNIKRSTVYQWVAEGRLPPPRQLGPNVVAWYWPEVEAALARAPITSARTMTGMARRSAHAKKRAQPSAD
jgi:excisionase family DNA binding protein